MDAQVFNILDRQRNSAASFARAKHFTCDTGQSVGAEILLEETGWTPYSIDDALKLVYFVQCPREFDLSTSAFVYTSQFEQAQRFLSISYQGLLELVPRMKRPEKVIFIHSMGRCGSTLMSQILNQVEGVYSLSEPDVFTLLSFLRPADDSRDAEFSALYEACALMTYPQGQVESRTCLVLKFRSNVISSSDLLQKAFPAAYNLFMYRNALGWAQSVYGFMSRLDYNLTEPFTREDASDLWVAFSGGDPAYLEGYLDAEPLYFSDLLVPAWTSYLDRYQQSRERGLAFHCLRYEELNQAREASLKALLDYCGLPSADLSKALAAFAKDSQEGTGIGRDTKVAGMSDAFKKSFLALLAQHPRFNDANLILGKG